MEIDDQMREKGKDAVKDDKWEEFRLELRSHLRERNPSASGRELRGEMQRLKTLFRAEVDPLKDTTEEEKTKYKLSRWMKALSKAFLYKDKPIKFEDLDDISFDMGHLLLTGWPFASDINQRKLLEALNHIMIYGKETDNLKLQKRMKGLATKLEDTFQRREHEKKGEVLTHVEFGWAEELGDLPLSNKSTRENIYGYWADKYRKFTPMKEALDDFLDKTEKLKTSALGDDENFKRSFEKFYEHVEELKRHGEPEQYILHLAPFSMEADDEFTLALNLMEQFQTLQGISEELDSIDRFSDVTPEQKEREKQERELGTQPEQAEAETSAGAAQTGSEALEEEFMGEVQADVREAASLPTPSRTREVRTKGYKQTVLVDPILWYQMEDDVTKLKMSHSQLNKVTDFLLGKRTEGKITRGLKFVQFEDFPEYEESFNKWYKNFKEQSEWSKSTKLLYLPISPFILDYINNIHGVERITVEDKVTYQGLQDILDNTGEFLELVAKLVDDIKVSFTVYQKGLREGERGKLGTFFAPHKATQRQRVAVGIKGEGTKYMPKELDAAWNNLIKTINEYYIIPVASKNFVQAGEKPRWARNQAANLLAIKGAKLNPIGALLDNALDKSLGGIKVKHVKGIREFIEEYRTGGARTWDDAIYRKGKHAVMGLNKLFATKEKTYNRKNEQSIGYLIFDYAKKTGKWESLRLEGKTLPDFLGNKLQEDNYGPSNFIKGYEEEKAKYVDYPIDMLRHALETPEFVAWAGLSGYRDKEQFGRAGANPYLDKKVATELEKLHAVYETFHKMDDVNVTLLDAHDVIRKMQNKPIIKASYSLDYIEHMDDIINKLDTEHNMDLTATEINKIVKAVSSYDSLARNFGINEEVVYTVKALFR